MNVSIKQNQAKISVIIPVYNTADYLPRCLDSVLHSSYHNLEVICVNDGSTDDSLRILQHYQSLDNRIIVIDQKNGGVSVARNKGMEQATGEFISFIDSDDWIHPQMFEILQKAMTDDVCVAVCDNKDVVQVESIEKVNTPHQIRIYATLRDAYSNLAIKHFVTRRLYRTSIVTGILFDSELSFSEDYFFNLKLSQKSGKCVFIEEKLYFYFQRPNSALHTVGLQEQCKMVEIFLDLAKKNNDDVRGLIYEEIIKRAFANRYEYMFSSESKEAATRAKSAVARALREVKKHRLLPPKKILIYSVMNEFPVFYRAFRIATNPSLLDWEKKQKRK